MKTNETSKKEEHQLEDLDYEDGEVFDPWKVGWGRTIKWWEQQKDLSPFEKRLLVTLLAYTNKKDGCYPGSKTLAQTLGASPWWVIKSLQRLEAKGYIKRIPEKARGRGHFNLYQFLFKSQVYTLDFNRPKKQVKSQVYTLDFNGQENPNSKQLKSQFSEDKIPILSKENPNSIPHRKDRKDLKDLKEEKDPKNPSLSLETTSPKTQDQKPTKQEKPPSLFSMNTEEGFSKGKDIWIERTLSIINPQYGMTKEKLGDLLNWICRDKGDWWRIPISIPEDLCRQIGKGKLLTQYEHRNDVSKGNGKDKGEGKRKPKSYVEVIKDDPEYQEWKEGIGSSEIDTSTTPEEEEQAEKEEEEIEEGFRDESDEESTNEEDKEQGKKAVKRMEELIKQPSDIAKAFSRPSFRKKGE